MLKRIALAAVLFALSCAVASAATCYVTEFTIGGSAAGTQVAVQPALVEQTVSVSGSSASSAAFSGDTKLVRIHCDSIVSVKFGTAPTATTASMRMPADATEYFQVLPGSKVAFITNT